MSDPNYSPQPIPGMTIDPRAKSDSWAIAGVLAGGASALILGGTAAVFQIANTKTGYSWPYVFLGVGISLGAKAGASLSNPSWTIFNTPLMGLDDFDSFGSLKGVEFTPIIGGALCYANIYSVDHSPNPIDVGGVTVGFALGANLTPGRFILIESKGQAGPQTSTPDQIAAATQAYLKNKVTPRWVA